MSAVLRANSNSLSLAGHTPESFGAEICSAKPINRTSGRAATQLLWRCSSAWERIPLSRDWSASRSWASSAWTSGASIDMLGNEWVVLARWNYWECRVASCGPIERLGLRRSRAQRTLEVMPVVSLERPCCFRPSQRKRGKQTGVAERVGQGRAGGCRGSKGFAGSRNNIAVNITRRVTERTKQEQLEARQRLGKSEGVRAGWAPKRGARCLDDIFLIGPGVGRWDAWMREWRGIRGFIFVGPVSLWLSPITCPWLCSWRHPTRPDHKDGGQAWAMIVLCQLLPRVRGPGFFRLGMIQKILFLSCGFPSSLCFGHAAAFW